jgi:glycosyltransferase involved in cell wall biosynthesis
MNALTYIGLLVPAHNCQEQLNATIRTLPPELPLRVLIIDDGSTPPLTLPHCDTVHDVRIVRNEKNLGIHGALRRGVELFHAEEIPYVARLDAGDFALPGRFVRQLQFLEAHADVAIVGSAWEAVDEQGRLMYTCRPPTEDADIRRLITLRTCLLHPAVMFRVAAVVRVGNYRDLYPCAEDLDLFLRLIQRYRAANLVEVLTRYEISSQSITGCRRRQMFRSTIRLQWLYLRPLCLADWVGLAKTLAHLTLPRSGVEQLKSWLRYDWRAGPRNVVTPHGRRS